MIEKISDIELIYARCYRCHSYDWWVSIYGKSFCNVCHPPASSRLVIFRIKSKEDLEEWKKVDIEKNGAIYSIKK